MVALVYLHRMSSQGLGFTNTMTIHRLFLTSLLLAAKYYDDLYFNNKFYARVGGFPVQNSMLSKSNFLLAPTFPWEFRMRTFFVSPIFSAIQRPQKTADPLAFFSVSPVIARPFFDTKATS